MATSRFIDWLRNLTAKSTTIDGTEQVHIDSSGLSQKATLANVLQYGGGNTTRVTTIGNANINQKSDGTMWLEVTGQTAGNARGAGAFDWQAERSSATQIASGANSIALGSRCTALGSYSLSAGFQSFASGANAIAVGLLCSASGSYSMAYGIYVLATNMSQFAMSSGSALGQAQGNIQIFYQSTSDASSVALSINGTASNRMVIPATRSCAFIGIVQAMCNVSSSSNFVKVWKIEGVITRDGNNTTRLVGTPTITELAKDADGTPTPSTWNIASITADDTNEALAINVTGQTGQTIRWQATLMYSQVGF